MDSRIKVFRGDITKVEVDAVVNAANSSLMGGGGVDGAIHRAGGPEIVKECMEIVRRQGGCKTGDAVITTAGKLPARYVIHTVGPVWHGGGNNEAEKLAGCYRNALMLAVKHHCKSIAFPNISTGVYGYPKADAARIACNAVIGFLNTGSPIEEVLFVCFDEENFNLITNQVENLHL